MDKVNSQEEFKQVVVFRLGDEEFAVDILQAKEIEKLDQGITRVPKAPIFVEGVINLRGVIVPIVDLRKRFGLVVRPVGHDTRVIIVEVNNNLIGMVVDSVAEVCRVNLADIEPTPQIAQGIDAYYLSGVVKLENERLIVLLNLERALSTSEAKELVAADLEV